MQTRVVEMMSSIQGEGPVVGYRQIFVRFAGCNLRCGYCDTPKGLEGQVKCQVEGTPGKRDFSFYNNPMTANQVSEIINYYNPDKHHSISFTGGEPLLHGDFILELVPLINKKKAKIYLETNGTLPERLAEVIESIDIISMDIKLPSVTGLNGFWAEHRRFLEVGFPKEIFVKAVFSMDTSNEEILEMIRTIVSVNKNIPLILQPMTNHEIRGEWPHPARVIEIQDLCLGYLDDVRVIPQTHIILGQL